MKSADKEAKSTSADSCNCVQIAPMEVGRINIQYRRTECTPPEPLNVDINHNFGPGAWLRIVVSVRLTISYIAEGTGNSPNVSAHHL